MQAASKCRQHCPVVNPKKKKSLSNGQDSREARIVNLVTKKKFKMMVSNTVPYEQVQLAKGSIQFNSTHLHFAKWVKLEHDFMLN